MISAQTLRVCREGKPVPTHRVVARGHAFPDHALSVLTALVDRDDAPAALETIDPRHRERIDDKAQRAVGIKIKRDGERGADRTGMHDEHDIARRQRCQPCIRAGNLIDKTFATGRPVAGRGFPEILAMNFPRLHNWRQTSAKNAFVCRPPRLYKPVASSPT